MHNAVCGVKCKFKTSVDCWSYAWRTVFFKLIKSVHSTDITVQPLPCEIVLIMSCKQAQDEVNSRKAGSK